MFILSRGIILGRKRIARIMQHLQLKALAKRKFKATTDSNHTMPVAKNLLNRNFKTSSPNQKWLTDISVPQQAV
jgi:transposase InsO family protein